MKTRINLCTVLFLAIAIMFAGCKKDKYDDAELRKQIAELQEQQKKADEQQKRIADLETQQKDFEAQQKDLEALVAALGNNDQITGITPITEAGAQVGYTITFKNSPAITVYNSSITSITPNADGTVTLTLTGGSKITILNMGAGTPADPRRIYNATDLDAIRNNLDGHYILMNDIALTSAWKPIGDNSTDNNTTRFTGSFDGNGHTITFENPNVVIASGNRHAGLFGYIGGNGSVRNLIVAGNITVVGTLTSYVGGIAGENRGTIENCAVLGNISVSSPNNNYAGGIAGQNWGGTINNCYATGAISASGVGGSVGGIAGANMYGIISNCVALNTSLSAAGSVVGRVYRIANNSSSSAFTNNYGRTDMGRTPAGAWTADAAGIDGANCTSTGSAPTNWGSQTFWRATLGWDNTIWDFSGISATSYPKLK